MTSHPGDEAIMQANAEKPIILRNSTGEWLRAWVFGLFVFQAMWTYHDLWRIGKHYGWPTAHEALALSASYCFAVALLLGPWHRITGLGVQLLRLRRPLGIVGAILTTAHMVIVCVILRWPLTTNERITSFVFGLLAVCIMIPLIATSFPWALKRFGTLGWRKVQSIAPLLLLLIIVHYLSLGKLPDWIKWFQTFDQPGHSVAPGGTFLLTIFCMVVFLVRCWAFGMNVFHHSKGQG